MPDAGISAHRGQDANRLLTDPGFQREWQGLLEACPWGTCIQSEAFIRTWYDCYGEQYEPLILSSADAAGTINGLFFLAAHRQSGELIHAGAHQAEYHVWLCRSGDSAFIQSALRHLRASGFQSLRLLFAPAGTPVGVFEDIDSEWTQRSVLRRLPRPLMTVGNGSTIEESLRKKSNKSRWNRLQKLGELEFVQLHDGRGLETDFDRIVAYTDFRQGAVNNASPFAEDPLKRAFYGRLMEYPELMHATVLRLSGKAIAAHLGYKNRNQVIIGVITHSPFVAQHSPGKFLILKLGQLLGAQGYSHADLTPGGEYKDRFADTEDEAYIVNIFLNDKALRRFRLERTAAAYGKRALASVGLTAGKAATAARLVRHKVSLLTPVQATRTVTRFAGKRIHNDAEVRVYRMTAEAARSLPEHVLVRADCLEDLLHYQPAEAWQSTRQAFLADAMRRIENGCRPYTLSKDGLLTHYGWLTPRPNSLFLDEVGERIVLPPNSAGAWDFYTHPAARGQGVYKRSLCTVCRDAAAIPGTEFIYISVSADNTASRRVIENVGFEYQGSVYRVVTLGRRAVRVVGLQLAASQPQQDAAHTEN